MSELPEPTAAPAVPPTLGMDVAALFERVEQVLLAGPRRYTREQVAAAAGLSTEQTNRLWRALGFATVGDDEVVFTDDDVQALRDASFVTERLAADDELQMAITRLLGRTFARLASFQGQLMTEMLSANPDLLDSEDDVVRFVEEVVPALGSIQDFVWRRQLVAYFSRAASHAAAEVTVPGVTPLAVGFVDMTGYTALTRRASEAELRRVLEAFEALVTEVVGGGGGRIVKTIGDEMLFVADETRDAAEIALRLQEGARADEQLPALRIGVAAGPVVSRLGDVYGSTVNIASRLTSLCRPGWVLVDRVMAEELREDPRYMLKPRRPEAVRGFHHLRQWRLRRAESSPAVG